MKSFFVLLVLLTCSALALGQSTRADLKLDPGVKAHTGIDAVYAKFSRAYRDLDMNWSADCIRPTPRILFPIRTS